MDKVMSAQITVTLPEDVLQRAEVLAERMGQPVADLLADTIEVALRPLGGENNDDALVRTLSDDQVIAAADAELPSDEDRRLSELLERQQADLLVNAEKSELAALIERYQDGLLRKAQAWREAVRRGLRESPQS
jgi:predicted DNA-binding protein